jgi:hypothetical protein
MHWNTHSTKAHYLFTSSCLRQTCRHCCEQPPQPAVRLHHHRHLAAAQGLFLRTRYQLSQQGQEASSDDHTFHLALEAPSLGLGATSSAVQAQDLLVVVDKRGEQFLAEYSLLLRLKHLRVQHHDFIAECSCVAGVGMKHSDGVANETVDVLVRHRLGGHVGGWLVVQVGRVKGGATHSP